MVDVHSVLSKFAPLEISFLMKKYIGIHNRARMPASKYLKVSPSIMVIGKFDKKYALRVIRGIMSNLLRFKPFLINLTLE
ncbi:Uncharacterised protein [Vibrio cholerae]|uniref:Uncharacterized protein n=1 Tax=Vibrio cholerae TaxID=666 RepID=A0A655XQF6_VIBCL|nr:Uncharacterised protein [Vibrio cholerae]CRZ89829.1 Uncharacterised protein [Vibrio cholerae]CSA80341.1 Uncharacterised protein [Vibrio cholerae]CSC19931.1 Uncharacterised protein [Vibrio cholerae]